LLKKKPNTERNVGKGTCGEVQKNLVQGIGKESRSPQETLRKHEENCRIQERREKTEKEGHRSHQKTAKLAWGGGGAYPARKESGKQTSDSKKEKVVKGGRQAVGK